MLGAFDLDAAENGNSCQHCVNKSGGGRWRALAFVTERDIARLPSCNRVFPNATRLSISDPAWLTMLSTFFQSRACGLQSSHCLAERARGGVPPAAMPWL
jgi:hypothetical protein